VRVPGPVRMAWREVALPSDPRGRATVRAVTACGGSRYAAGAIVAPGGRTTPAVWASRGGAAFTSMRVEPRSYYGRTNVLSTLACRSGVLVAVGADAGGAHGNLRISTWYAEPGGPLREHPAGLDLFGGSAGIGVGAITAGVPGFLLAGARVDRTGGAGAAVWTSPDGRVFTVRDGAAALESGSAGTTELRAVAPAGTGYVGVGDLTPPRSPGAARDPIAWTSPDGVSWRRVAFPATSADDLLLAVAPERGPVAGGAGTASAGSGAGLIAVGTSGSRYTVWSAREDGTGWHRVATFGDTGASVAVPTVPSLVTARGTTYAVVTTAGGYRMWRGRGANWTQVGLPVGVPVQPQRSGPRTVVATADATDVMIATDDGTGARIWVTPA